MKIELVHDFYGQSYLHIDHLGDGIFKRPILNMHHPYIVVCCAHRKTKSILWATLSDCAPHWPDRQKNVCALSTVFLILPKYILNSQNFFSSRKRSNEYWSTPLEIRMKYLKRIETLSKSHQFSPWFRKFQLEMRFIAWQKRATGQTTVVSTNYRNNPIYRLNRVACTYTFPTECHAEKCVHGECRNVESMNLWIENSRSVPKWRHPFNLDVNIPRYCLCTMDWTHPTLGILFQHMINMWEPFCCLPKNQLKHVYERMLLSKLIKDFLEWVSSWVLHNDKSISIHCRNMQNFYHRLYSFQNNIFAPLFYCIIRSNGDTFIQGINVYFDSRRFVFLLNAAKCVRWFIDEH